MRKRKYNLEISDAKSHMTFTDDSGLNSSTLFKIKIICPNEELNNYLIFS